MGFIHRRTSKQTSKVKTLLGLALSRLAAARRPRLARKSISRSDVGQLLALRHLDRALHRAEQLIEEDNMLESFNIIELYCNRLIEHTKQLDKPHECGEDIRGAAAGIMFAAGRCSDLPELLFARTILANKFGGDFAMMAKEGTGVVDPMLVWKLSGNKRNMEMKKKVVKEIAAENNVLLDFCEFQEVVEQDGSSNVPHHHKLSHEAIYQIDMDESSESDSYHFPSHNKDPCDISNSDGANNGHPKQKNMKTCAHKKTNFQSIQLRCNNPE